VAGETGEARMTVAILPAQLAHSADGVVDAAREYRAAEQDGTPRMFRGIELQSFERAL
jgi:hypothetical protein